MVSGMLGAALGAWACIGPVAGNLTPNCRIRLDTVWLMSAPGPAAASDVLREQVRRAVAEHVPGDHAERRSIEIVLTELERLPDPFSEHADPVHVTGSAIVVGPRGVILLRHKRLGLWLQPGGHIDPGETPWDAAWRETIEETGLPLEPCRSEPELVHVDVHPGGRGHTHLDLRYLARVAVVDGVDPDPQPPAGESQEVHWFDWPAAVARASDDRLKGLLARLTPTVGV